MTNWTIFLLHFVAAYFYVKAGEAGVENNSFWFFNIAVILTITAAWI